MRIEKFSVGPLEACCYVVSNEDTGEVVIIDPGGDHERIVTYIRENNLTPKLLINTHGHGDHIGSNKEIKETFPGVKIAIHYEDADCLTHPSKNLSFLGGFLLKSPPADIVLKEGDKVGVEGVEFEVIHTPGHTPGSICLLSRPTGENGRPVLFSGDSLFQGGIGRTDLPGGDFAALIKSLKDKILTLDGETVVYPGHGPLTTVGEERANNPFLQTT